MQTNKPGQQGFKPRVKGGFTNHANFIEALKANGSAVVKNTANSFKNDVLIGSGQQMVDSFFGTNQFGGNGPSQEQSPDFDFNEYIKSTELKTRAQDRVTYEYEQQETIIFNRRQEEVNKKIEEIKIELKRIKHQIGTIDQSTQTIIDQQEVKPGTYHLNFLIRLLQFLRDIRQRIEARHWHATTNQRTQAKSYYWQQAHAKVSGTKFMLSQERQVATQTG